MSIARKDDRHNDDLVKEIADGFNRAVGSKKSEDEAEKPKPKFVVTGDSRTPPPRGRKSR
ncbi:hypothetical protein [Amycolatopsis sp. CA-230715]|uniref:hypothetical protein n=1 Tax=Amycolatopsis sp. CA-230715 TaxID=2745196 RepID=UPI001C01CAA4|nr:hypothetical protein [Amycolatopsis sp. CA-230715]QWF79246.1 hypothetical protein HUW46_02653 [Amycolatopsis sp. CA-230715]